jgi:hypothetical protein
MPLAHRPLRALRSRAPARAIEKLKAKPPQDYDVMCPEVTAALAFQQLADTSKALDDVKRYEGSIRSAFNSAWRQLSALKKGDPPIPYPFPQPDSYPTEIIQPEQPTEPTNSDLTVRCIVDMSP